MNEFRPYNHLEKSGHREVEGIFSGLVYIFPKIDGTNASVWGVGVRTGSRSRALSEGSDNAGFNAWVNGGSYEALRLRQFVMLNPSLIVYGEWLVKHTIAYNPTAYNTFYIFDVYDRRSGRYLPFDHEHYRALASDNLSVVCPLAIIENPKSTDIEAAVAGNTYLMPEGQIGEGVVCKNYDWANEFGRQPWLKVVREGFHRRKVKKVERSATEVEIAEAFVDQHLVDKNVAKARIEVGDDRAKIIPVVLGRVFQDLINEEVPHILKKFKMPIIDFKKLRSATVDRVKDLAPELF